MAYRGLDVVLPWTTRHALLILAKSSGGKKLIDQIVTEVVDAWLAQNHPDVVAFVAKQMADEVELVTALTPPEQQKKAKAKPKQAQPEIVDDFPNWEKQA